MRLNASVFFMDWKDLQIEAFRFLTPGDLSSNFEQTINADSEATGIEVELLAAPTEYLTLGGSIGDLDTEITDEPVCDPALEFGPTCIQLTGGFAVSAIGLEMPKAPELTANAFAEYRFPIGSNEAWLRGEYVHRDSMYSDIEALTNLQTRGPSPNGLANGQTLIRVVGSDEFPYKVPSFDVATCAVGSSGSAPRSPCMWRTCSMRTTTRAAGEFRVKRVSPPAAPADLRRPGRFPVLIWPSWSSGVRRVLAGSRRCGGDRVRRHRTSNGRAGNGCDDGSF